ncbi:site-specific tyrosine recombinase XerD [Falsarthrobacter nasiphocae]|uniref:Tyrosine recombinase XerD n=1 Tax=Falsarthrobacter nasiphocae TaxID=189863 RepID=A0AAE3YF85_9MICC|nr:site-specific tyrosine recombinase XerD [Falsarthrobacter nasiphocae]MDR6892728.1 integrase/recombinase XerD [Falsarthrobacter nasiphocae]
MPTGPDPAAAPPTPLRAAADEYLRHLALERGLAANTIASYGRDLARYERFLAVRGIDRPGNVTANLVSDFAVALRSGDEGPALAPRSAARIVVAIRGFHAFLLAEGTTTTDPAARVRPPSPPSRLPKALTVDQVSRMLESASVEEPLGLRDRALLEFLYGTGARVSEAVGLALDDLHQVEEDDGTGLALVRLMGKGSKQRLVPIGSFALRALDEYRVRGRPALAAKNSGKTGNGGALFLNARGGRLSRQSAWTIIQRAAEAAGIADPVSPHTLRHSFATHLVEGGADIRAVQELMGHASISSTQIYTKVTVDTLREVYATSHPRAR